MKEPGGVNGHGPPGEPLPKEVLDDSAMAEGFVSDLPEAALNSIYSKTSRIILPLFLAISTINHLDRTNLAFASLTMNADLGFNASTYGLGSALFFIGFVVCQVPSNMIMLRVGARLWLSLLLVAWGTIATCSMFIHDKASFFVMRVLLGAFEAGAFPAMWFYLSLFYSAERIVKPFAWLNIGILLANVLGAPLAFGFLSMDGISGLHGWQWLFLLEGLPAVIIGLVVFFTLPNSAKQAKWLTTEQKQLLNDDIAAKAVDPLSPGLTATARTSTPGQQKTLAKQPLKLLVIALRNPLLYYLIFCGILFAMAAYTMLYWLPIVVNALLKGQALAGLQVASKESSKLQGALPILLAAIPYTCGAISSWLIAHSSQKRRELFIHTAVPFILAGIFFMLFTPLTKANFILGFLSLVFTVTFAGAGNGVMVALVADLTAGPAQAVAMPLYNCIASMGGFIGPFVTGALIQRQGGFQWVSILMGSMVLIMGCMVLALRWIAAAWRRKLAKSRSGVSASSQSAVGGGFGYSAASAISKASGPDDMAEAGGISSGVSVSASERSTVAMLGGNGASSADPRRFLASGEVAQCSPRKKWGQGASK